jgi:hypothetical protein
MGAELTGLMTPEIRQMLLGTLLGDGSMCWLSRLGRFRITHGACQTAYCLHKAELLKNYLGTPPQLTENKGWGKKSCVFWTLTSPDFEFLRSMCYVENFRAKQVRLKKRVTKEWASELTPRSLAYWYMDDGSMSSRGMITLHTEGFSVREVQLLSSALARHGVESSISHVPRRGRSTKYRVIKLNTVNTREFVELVRPYIHESMAYKIQLPEFHSHQTVLCTFCKSPVRRVCRSDDRMVVCESSKCERLHRKIINRRYETAHRDEINARGKAYWQRNLEENRRRAAEAARRRREDPDFRAKINEAKRIRRAAEAAARVPEMVVCSFCGGLVARKNRSKNLTRLVACQNPACQKERHRIHAIASAERHPRALKIPVPCVCSYCGKTVERKRPRPDGLTICGPECLKVHRRELGRLKTANAGPKVGLCEICGTSFTKVRNQKTCGNQECTIQLRERRLKQATA